ncbi:mannosyl-oligosaccharide glucosidase [Athalia rosae]|uniref:mannosyl-oligosaccharide glucosidase n=1 Tax=Athalia rosae TaxID=37344 RepID=UPI0006265F74|nr:mannosyl-oligosaccharide glucosidase [Athalia rosae]XP_012259976.1 mannosyl-oligosaccharide glucosidase [Athalia rosae]XP_012259977.1 mannosyl-oligosaccharide glucosidase [Athalia rosae]XP_048507221.1 mannosyl-oligosaccharide glucosidase [Athalia rosae]
MARTKHQEKPPKPKAKSIGTNENKKEYSTKIPMLNSILAVLCILVAAWFSYKGYLETRVNTPFDTEKLVIETGLDVPERYWGTYSSGIYFALKTRDPHSLVTGLMWYFPQHLRQGGEGFRHWCEQGDRLDRYAWLEHDGRNFGIQEILDGGAVIKTSFVKKLGGSHGGDWTARIAVSSEQKERDGEEISLLYYTAIEEKTKGWIKAASGGDDKLTGVTGETDGLGTFKLDINPISGVVEEHSYLVTAAPGLHVLKETVLHNLQLASQKVGSKRRIILGGEQLPLDTKGKEVQPNFIVSQVTAKIPFEFEVTFESGSFLDRGEKLTGKTYDTTLEKQRKVFNDKFEKVFKLKSKGFKDDEISFAKMAFSNMIGSIGYFYGSSLVQSEYTKGSVPYWKAPLYSGVPSRSFFPRGFLWDEGFHGLLISAWDLDIELDIISHWFDLMNVEGWIPREMILGQEALAKVPEEFITQVNTNANPPTFFLTLQSILKRYNGEFSEKNIQALERLYPRLQTWFDWYNTTQTGDLPGTYRWRGRDPTAIREVNPKTLTSGLDDYPRASHPNVDERHVDLRCWIAFSANIMAQISEVVKRPGCKYSDTFSYLSNNDILNKLHWSPGARRYCDYGLHTDKVVLRRPKPPPRSHSPTSEMIRVVLEDPTLRYVDTTFGYVSLFPFILELIEPNSPQLGKILEDLTNPDLLWTNYGLRSLAKNAPLYMGRNTEHDPPYWRGAIWMNINYLVVRSLKHYSKYEGPHRAKSLKIYNELRQNLIRNVISKYKQSGYMWENYGDTHGEGKGSHPFTGWTSLIVLIMSELY